MKKRVVLGLFLLLAISIVVPAVAFGGELVGNATISVILPPLALMTFGFLALVGGIAGYAWRHRSEG
jgi:hypothetical protein